MSISLLLDALYSHLLLLGFSIVSFVLLFFYFFTTLQNKQIYGEIIIFPKIDLFTCNFIYTKKKKKLFI